MTKRICMLDDCGRPHRGLGYCNRHYLKFKRFGDPLYATQRPDRPFCSIEGCREESRARGWCIKHYGRWRATGDPTGTKPRRERPPCSYEGCGKPHAANGYCGTHASRVRRTGTVEARGGRTDCVVQDCVRVHWSGGYCSMHGQRVRKYGEPGPAFSFIGDGSPRRQGNGGYVMMTINGRRVSEHRYVMERALGRPLTADENVHHVNGDRQDNRLANLELWNTSQPAGQRVDDKVKWAADLLRLYAPELLSSPRLGAAS